MRNETRLKRLEARHGAVCPTCGFTGDCSAVKYEVGFADPDKEPRENEYCETCGRPTRIVLRW